MKTMMFVVLFLGLVGKIGAVEYKVIRLRGFNTSETKQSEVLNREAAQGWFLDEVSRMTDGTIIDLYLIKDEGNGQ